MKNLLPYFFIVLYLFIIIVPGFGSVDKADTQWLFLGFLNMSVLIFNIFSSKVFKLPKTYFILFIIFLFTSFFSLLFAINSFEGLFTFLNYFNVFLTIINLYLLISNNSNIIQFSLYILTFFLCVELYYIYSVFLENITNYDRSDLSGTSGNVIISTFSVLIKLPFIIYLFFSNKYKFFKFILAIILLLSCYYILFLSGTRSAFLAFCLISTIFIYYNFSYIKKKIFYFLPIIFSFFFLIFNYSGRLFVAFDSSTSARIRYYIDAVQVFFSSPIFGIGVGNWQIISLLKDRFYIEEYQVPLFVHNDYLQVLAESGLFSFLLFISIIIYPFYVLRNSLNHLNFKNLNFYILLSLFVFSIDLFFNFPLSRPTILIIYSFIISLFLYLNKHLFSNLITKKLYAFSVLFLVSISVLVFSIINFDFSKTQKIILFDFNQSDFTSNYSVVSKINSFESLLGPTSIPLSSNLSKYYLENDSLSKAMDLARKGILANPYHSLSYDVLSKSYEKKNKLDSAYFYAKKSFDLSPRNIVSSSQLMVVLEKQKKISEIDSVFQLIKNYNHDIDWLNYIKIHSGFQIKSKKEIVKLIDEAIKLFPQNQDFIIQRAIVVNGPIVIETANFFDQKARSEFANSNFKEAFDLWSKASDYLPSEFAYIQNMSSCLVNLFRFQEAIDLLLSIPEGDYPANGRVEYILGTAYNKLKLTDKACFWLAKGIRKGDTGASNLSRQICN